MKNFNFKQGISNIFTLKSKTVTLLLGTFVPFFVCYILWYVPKKFVFRIPNEQPDPYKHVLKMKRYFLLLSTLFTIFLIIIYASEIRYVWSINYFKFLAINFYLAVDFGVNFILTQIFYALFEILREQKSS
jgi:hypothetical protein